MNIGDKCTLRYLQLHDTENLSVLNILFIFQSEGIILSQACVTKVHVTVSF